MVFIDYCASMLQALPDDERKLLMACCVCMLVQLFVLVRFSSLLHALDVPMEAVYEPCEENEGDLKGAIRLVSHEDAAAFIRERTA